MRILFDAVRRQRLAPLALVLAINSSTGFGQSPATPPTPAPATTTTASAPQITLRYREIQRPAELKMRLGDQVATKSVGEMAFEYPAGSFPVQGIDPSLKTFCVEALVPIHSGNVYNFQMESPGKPEFFGLPDTADGRLAAEKRLTYIRELYGRYYQDLLTDPDKTVAAFQTALWEVIQERNLAEGPSPFNLFQGYFKADYPTEAQSPEFVQLAQKYVLSLTGTDATFNTNPALSGLELIRFTGLASANAPAPQSQLGLRGFNASNSNAVEGSGGLAPAVGSSGQLPTGIPTMGNGLSGPARGLPGTGFNPNSLGGAGGAGFPFFGQPFTTAASNSPVPVTSLPISLLTTDLGTSTGASSQSPANQPNALTPTTNTPTSNLPNAPLPPTTNNPNTPTTPTTPLTPGTPNTPQNNNPVPAPPAVLLGLIGMGVLAVRKWLKREAAPTA